MNHDEFERFVLKFGKDILRFCRMTAGDAGRRGRTVSGHDAQTAGEKEETGLCAEYKELCFIHFYLSLEKQKEKICKPDEAGSDEQYG